MQTLRWMTECIMCLPLFGGVVAGLLGKVMGRTTTHRLTIALVGLAALMSAYVLVQVVRFDLHDHWIWYHWLNAGMMHAHVGFLLDPLAGMMLLTVTGISTLVHIYSIGYMHDEDGYQRFLLTCLYSLLRCWHWCLPIIFFNCSLVGKVLGLCPIY